VIIKYAILLAIVLVLPGSPHGIPARPSLPGNRAPARCGSACTCGCTPAKLRHAVSLWLQLVRFAVLRRSGHIRPASRCATG